MPAGASVAVFEQTKPSPAASDDRLDRFIPRTTDPDHRIDYSVWGNALRNLVIGFGPPQRIPARRNFANDTRWDVAGDLNGYLVGVGASSRGGHISRIRLEGTRIAFSFFTDDVSASLSDYRRDLERVGSEVDIPSLSRNEQLAYWLNLHNVAVIEQIAQHYPVMSPRKIRIDGEPLDTARFIEIDGVKLSLNDIRTRIVYPNWSDPRVIYGFFRGEIGGPQIQPLEFNARNLNALLEENAFEFINSLRGAEKHGGSLLVSRIFDEAAPYYFADFDSDLLDHLGEFAKDDVAQEIDKTQRIKFSRYWNDIADLARGQQVFDRRLIRTYDSESGELVRQQVMPAHIARYIIERRRKIEYLRRTGQRLWTIRLIPVDLPGQPATIVEVQ